MPKLLVLFHPSPDVVHIAEAVAEGARSVRFAEVDLRHMGGDANGADLPGARVYRELERLEDAESYDGIVVGVADAASADALAARLTGLGGHLTNKVASAFTPASGTARQGILWAALTPLADRGMILVPAPFGDGEVAGDAKDAAGRLGRRVAEVVGWITHARSHHHHHHP